MRTYYSIIGDFMTVTNQLSDTLPEMSYHKFNYVPHI